MGDYTPYKLVRNQFHLHFQVEQNAVPGHFKDRETAQLRWELVKEEFIEFAGALGISEVGLRAGIEPFDVPDDVLDQPLVPIIKEAIDLEYVIVGTLAVLGVDGDDAFAEVHGSNLSKLDPLTGKPLRRFDGKILKGPDYFEPSLDRLVYPVGDPYTDQEAFDRMEDTYGGVRPV